MKRIRTLYFITLKLVLIIAGVLYPLRNVYSSIWERPTRAMVAYGEGTVTTPRFRTWGGTSWGTENSAKDVTGTIQWVVLKHCPKRNEKILGILDSNGTIRVQVWNGTSWLIKIGC